MSCVLWNNPGIHPGALDFLSFINDIGAAFSFKFCLFAGDPKVWSRVVKGSVDILKHQIDLVNFDLNTMKCL